MIYVMTVSPRTRILKEALTRLRRPVAQRIRFILNLGSEIEMIAKYPSTSEGLFAEAGNARHIHARTWGAE
jgi:hypothetical protein